MTRYYRDSTSGAAGRTVPRRPTRRQKPAHPERRTTIATTSDRNVLDRLRDAIDSHDPARVAACFTDDYRGDLPHHPARSFTGSSSVQANWTAIFAAVPDITATVLRTAINNAEIWSEWELTGTDTHGSPVVFVGPVIFTTREGEIAWARFYLDRVTTAPD